MMSKARRQAIDWLCKLSEIQFQLALFLAEDDYDSFLEAKDLLEQLAREVLRDHDKNPVLMPDGGMASYPLELPGRGGKTIEALIAELEEAVEARLAELEARLEELRAEAIPGSLRSKYVSCGKPNCTKCPHGPYYYLRRPDGKEEYVRREDLPAVEAGIRAWKEAQDLAQKLRIARDIWHHIKIELDMLLIELEEVLPQSSREILSTDGGKIDDSHV